MAIWNKKQASTNNAELTQKTDTTSMPATLEKASLSDGSHQASTKTPKLAVAVAVCLILLGVGLVAVYYNQVRKEGVTKKTEVNKIDANKPLLDKEKALEHAKESLAKAPNDPDVLLSAAEIARDIKPEEAKKYYAIAFENYKKDNSLNDVGETKTAITYWGGANLAEQAGYNAEAIKYYKVVIEKADHSDSYEKYISEQSGVAIKRLTQ